MTHNAVGEVDIIEVYEFETLVWKREEKPVEILDEVEKKYLIIDQRKLKPKSILEKENRLQGRLYQFKKTKGTLFS